ncbi:hypothetical protein AB0K35_28045 [Micromonospora sp. NPDC053740]|uniref:hypothetical protein n=1 Tax=Micromonospora sp. NPDC053740 TaxID=3155173 RepID=UPI00343338B6
MAEIPVRTPSYEGLNLNLTAAAASDTAKCGPGYRLLVNNGSGSSMTVTIAVPGNTSYGVAAPDKVFTIPAGQLWEIPLLDVYRDPADRLAHLTWSSTTTVTRIVVKR